MKKIFIIAVAAILVACENKSKTPLETGVWSLEAPTWYSPSSGDSRSFEQFRNMALKKMVTDDVISFKEGPTNQIQLDVTTSCVTDQRKFQTHFQIPLPEQINLFQILPAEAWLNPKIKPICSLQFVAKNPAGSMHIFDVQNLPLEIRTLNPNLKINRLSDVKSEDQKLLYRDHLDEFFFYSRAGQKYQMLCETNYSRAYTIGGANITRLVEFQQTSERNEMTNPREFCRLVELDKTDLITGYSQNFYIFSEEPRLEIDQRRSIRLRYEAQQSNPSMSLQTWTLKNPMAMPLHMALPDLSGQSLRAEFVFVGAPQHFAYALDVPTKWIGGSLNKQNQLVVTIPAHSEVTLTMAMAQRFQCINVQPLGYWAKAPADASVTASVLLNPNGDLGAENVLAEVTLHLVDSRWVGRMRGTMIPDYDARFFDEFSSLPLTAKVVGPLRQCRLIQ